MVSGLLVLPALMLVLGGREVRRESRKVSLLSFCRGVCPGVCQQRQPPGLSW